jgi:hypothetical protein
LFVVGDDALELEPSSVATPEVVSPTPYDCKSIPRKQKKEKEDQRGAGYLIDNQRIKEDAAQYSFPVL